VRRRSAGQGGTDFFKIGEQPAPADCAVWARVRRFVDDGVLPAVDA
jgi:hypothetical protein